jgi:antitoxin VapB
MPVARTRTFKSVAAMIKRLRSLPTPPTIEQRDTEELPERKRL